VNISLKPIELAPGDITSDQMRAVADLADKYSISEIRTTHQQNIVLPHVKKADLYALYTELKTCRSYWYSWPRESWRRILPSQTRW